MITQVGSKITKSKWPFATARIAFFVSAWNKEIKFMPILCQIRFVLDDNIAIYINPVRIIKIFYAGSVADGSIENVVTSGCSSTIWVWTFSLVLGSIGFEAASARAIVANKRTTA